MGGRSRAFRRDHRSSALHAIAGALAHPRRADMARREQRRDRMAAAGAELVVLQHWTVTSGTLLHAVLSGADCAFGSFPEGRDVSLMYSAGPFGRGSIRTGMLPDRIWISR